MDTSLGDDEDPDNLLSKKREGTDGDGAGRVAKQVNLLDHPSQKGASISPVKEQEKKRTRKNGGGEEDDITKTNIRSALSFEESGRA
jgi:hypothetical protein